MERRADNVKPTMTHVLLLRKTLLSIAAIPTYDTAVAMSRVMRNVVLESMMTGRSRK